LARIDAELATLRNGTTAGPPPSPTSPTPAAEPAAPGAALAAGYLPEPLLRHVENVPPGPDSQWPDFVRIEGVPPVPPAGEGVAPEPSAPTAAPTPPGDDANRRDDAHSAVLAAERRVEQNRIVAGQVAQLEASLAEHAATEQQAAEAVAAAEREVHEASTVDGLASAQAAVSEAEATLAAARAAEEDAQRRLAAPVAEDASGAAALIAAHESRLADAKAAEAVAAADVAVAEQALADAERTVSDAVDAEQAEAAAEAATSEPTSSDELLEEIEWYLLARLAGQRAVSAAGSVPLVLDDPFHALEGDAGVRLVARLERMASAVQVVVVSDAPDLAEWARGLGPDRASVLELAGS
ncbi:MAG: hypothetical protein JWM05_2093, partial [Acidimicrobiales bacterium]|nr:hypothetical protein [Acidimicrobiales bacterium]